MFTLKVFRTNSRNDKRMDMYETQHPEVYTRDRGEESMPVREVAWRDPNTGEWPVVVLDPDALKDRPTEGEWVTERVVIENAAGKTTDVVRVVY